MSDNDNKTPSGARNRRRGTWARPDLQLKIILMTLCMGVLVLLINYQLNSFGLVGIRNNPALTFAEMFQEVRSCLFNQMIVSFCLVVPVSIWIGAIYAFKFCGPIYRFKRFFDGHLDGQWDKPCSLRKGDDLHDLKDSINAAMKVIHQKIRRQNDLLMDVRTVLEDPSASMESDGKSLDLIQRIDTESADFADRFADSEPLAELVTSSKNQSEK